jgi:hypothetical protein
VGGQRGETREERPSAALGRQSPPFAKGAKDGAPSSTFVMWRWLDGGPPRKAVPTRAVTSRLLCLLDMENSGASGSGIALASPLVEVERKSGGRHGVWFGTTLPDDFGDWREEYGFLRESVALLDKNYRAYLEFTGPDRVRYLNAILTNNVKDLLPNHGVVSLLLSPQGRILRVVCDDSRAADRGSG